MTWIYIYFMIILTLFFIRPKKLQQKYTEISNALNRELKQRRFWATHVNRKWDLFHLKSPRREGGGRVQARGSNEPPLQVNDGWLKTQAVNFQLLTNSSQTQPTLLLALPNLYFFLTKNFGKNTAEEWRSPLPASWRREFFISRRRQPQKTSLEKWICVLSISIAITPNHLLCQMQANPFWAEFLRTISSSERERKFSRRLFTSMIKREIRHFPVVVVQWRQRNVQKSVTHVQRCCLDSVQPIVFWHVIVVVAFVAS